MLWELWELLLKETIVRSTVTMERQILVNEQFSYRNVFKPIKIPFFFFPKRENILIALAFIIFALFFVIILTMLPCF